MSKRGNKIKNKKGDICSICGINLVTSVGYGKYRNRCFSCYKKPWILLRKKYCESCGFIPMHLCQLDVDHIDGDKKNNKLDNLRTLCANCHRLKTQIEKNYMKNHLK
jgi:5-methylcytosine-specific restriction endonuclease McrA